MSFKSVTEENTIPNAHNVQFELQSKTNKVISQIDPFLLQDLSLAIQQVYCLHISDMDGKTTSYRLRDALINIDAIDSNMLLPLKLEVEINEKISTLDFNISRIDADTNMGSIENPKYYIYCDNSNETIFRFWFKKIK